MEIVTIGGATQDIFIHHEDIQTIDLERNNEKKSFLLLQEGLKIEVDAIQYSIGGGATNSAVAFKRLGFNVSSFFKVGQDQQGIVVLDSLKKEGVSVKNCIIDNNYQTGMSYIIPSYQGERTVLAFRGANAYIKEYELPVSSFGDFSYAYITSLSGESSHVLLPLAKEAKKKSLLVAINPGRSQLLAGATMVCESLAYTDILILNKEEAHQLMISLFQTNQKLYASLHSQLATGHEQLPSLLTNLFTYEDKCFNLLHFFKEVSSRGPKTIVVTNGAEGVYVCANKSIYFHPSIPIKIVNTLGAGDAFGSTFVAGLALYKSVEKAIRGGIVNSLSVISHKDAKSGLLHKDELEYELSKLDNSLLKKFEFS